MASDPTRTVSKQVRVIFPDGLPRGLDASQVKLVVHNPERESDGGHERNGDGTVNAQQNRDGTGAAADHPAAATLPGQNESSMAHGDATPGNEHGGENGMPKPVAAEACPAAPPPPQGESEPAAARDLQTASARQAPGKSRAEAARENGRKSRGPVTPEGKARSSQNALKHGLSSRHVVIGEEEEEEWLEFRDECRQTLKPVGAIELGYVDEFASSRWRLRRCLGIETSIFDYQFAMQKIYDEKRCSEMDGVGRTGMAFKSAKDHLTALGRYETRIRRSGERAFANLLRLQSMRQNEPGNPAAPDDSTEPTTAEAPPAAVNPQNEPNEVAPSHKPQTSKADVPVREPAPEPVQPGARSAAGLRNEPGNPAAPEDSTQPTTAEAPPAAVNPQNEPNEVAPSHKPQTSRAEALVCEPAPEPVQPGARSAAGLRNEPEKPAAPDDSTQPTTAQAPPA